MTILEPEAPRVWTVHCDASVLTNPGSIGIGVILTDPSGNCHTLSEVTGTKGCNNEAELRALMAALHEAKRHGAARLQIYSDSRVVVEQLGPLPVRPIARLALVFEEARGLLKAFEHVRLQWIPRHRNGRADALARAALGIKLPPPGAPDPDNRKTGKGSAGHNKLRRTASAASATASTGTVSTTPTLK